MESWPIFVVENICLMLRLGQARLEKSTVGLGYGLGSLKIRKTQPYVYFWFSEQKIK